MKTNNERQQKEASVFWGEIAPFEHILQIYEDDDSFLDVLTGFVNDGIKEEEVVIVIATSSHLQHLEQRLKVYDVNLPLLLSNGYYVPLDAEETLGKFMVDGWPDERLFMDVVGGLITNARTGNRKVRAFGEMVALLWAQGNNGATVNLEHLWNNLCNSELCSVFCAYPKSGFTQDASESIMHICNSHSRMISGKGNKVAEVFYHSIKSGEGL